MSSHSATTVSFPMSSTFVCMAFQILEKVIFNLTVSILFKPIQVYKTLETSDSEKEKADKF